jgi:PST family polysaccharide transporter
MNFGTDDVLSVPRNGAAGGNERHFQTDHLLKDLDARSFRGSVVTLVGQAVKFLLQMISTVVLARLLKPEDFGLVAMVSVITLLIGMWTDLGLPSATIQRAEITQAQVSVLFWVNCALSFSAAIFVAILAPVIAWFYHEPRLICVTLALSLIFVLGGPTMQHRALLRRQMRFKLITIIDCVSMAFGIATGIAMAWLNFGYWSLVGIQVGAASAACALVWAVCDWRPSAFKRRVGARPMLAFGGNLTGFTLLNYFTRNFDNILIGRVLGSSALGIYSKAYGLLQLPVSQIGVPMAAALLPALSRLQDKPSEYAKLLLRALGAMTFISVPIVVFSFFLARDIVLVLLGHQWLSVVPVFQLLAPAAAVGGIAIAPNWICQSLGRTRRQLHYALISAPVCVTGFLLGIKWGVNGVAASFSVTFPVVICGYIWYSTLNSPVKPSQIWFCFWSAFWPSCIAGIAAFAFRRALNPNIQSIIALFLCVLVFGGLYLGCILVLKTSRQPIYAALASLRQSARN